MSVIQRKWLKARSLRSFATLIVFTLVGMTSVTMFSAVGLVATLEGPTEMVNEQSVQGLPTVGLYLGHLVLGALGVLIGSADYATENTSTTVTSAPRRVSALLAKGLLAGLIGAAVGMVGSLAVMAVGIGALLHNSTCPPKQAPSSC